MRISHAGFRITDVPRLPRADVSPDAYENGGRVVLCVAGALPAAGGGEQPEHILDFDEPEFRQFAAAMTAIVSLLDDAKRSREAASGFIAPSAGEAQTQQFSAVKDDGEPWLFGSDWYPGTHNSMLVHPDWNDCRWPDAPCVGHPSSQVEGWK